MATAVIKFNPNTGVALKPGETVIKDGVSYTEGQLLDLTTNKPIAPTAPAVSTPAPVAPTPAAPVVTSSWQQAAQNPANGQVVNAPLSTNPTPVAPVAPPQTQTQTYSGAANYAGTSIVDFLNLAKQPSDVTSRANLAVQYGLIPTTQAYIDMANNGTNGTINTKLLGLLKAQGAGTTTPTGVPTNVTSTLGVNATPITPNTPINPANLPKTGSTDISSVLSAAINGNGNGTADLAGLLSLFGASTDASKEVDKTTKTLTDLITSTGNEGADIQAALNANGTNADIAHVKELNLKATQLKGELEAFDNETEQISGRIGDQPIPTGLILGQQAQLKQQRDETRQGKLSELATTIALAQTYQGNVELGMKLAEQAVNLKYKPILAQIEATKVQLAAATSKMNATDAKNVKVIEALLNIKQNEINTEKANLTKLQTLGVQAASGGAPIGAVNAAIATGDLIAASAQLAPWLKGPTESLKSATAAGAKPQFTTTQKNNGAQNAGVSISAFDSLDPDVQNFFVSAPPASIKTFNEALAEVKDGTTSAAELKQTIDGWGIAPSVKEYMKKQVDAVAPAGSESGGFFSWLSSTWDSIFGSE